jgi:hypothetical protein
LFAVSMHPGRPSVSSFCLHFSVVFIVKVLRGMY